MTDSDANLAFDINADTPTMNDQITKNMKKLNKAIPETELNRVIQIDKDLLKTLVIEFLSLDDQINSYRDAIKDLTEEKKQYEAQILELMTLMQQTTINTTNGNLAKNEKKLSGPLTPDLIKSALTEILKCPDTATTYTDHIMDKRATKSKVALKRNKNKQPKQAKQAKKPLINK